MNDSKATPVAQAGTALIWKRHNAAAWSGSYYMALTLNGGFYYIGGGGGRRGTAITSHTVFGGVTPMAP
jgi:hypothetical protein